MLILQFSVLCLSAYHYRNDVGITGNRPTPEPHIRFKRVRICNALGCQSCRPDPSYVPLEQVPLAKIHSCRPAVPAAILLWIRLTQAQRYIMSEYIVAPL